VGLLARPRSAAWRVRARSDWKFWDEWHEAWESVRWEAEFFDAGEHVVTPLTSHHRGREGIEVQAHAALVLTFRDGSIARITFYQGREEALEAAGLSE
jgi:ketosteroid isomerase-like protein